MNLRSYRTLGRSGLAVSPLALGAMTFATRRWGADEAGSRAIFDAYVDAGGNFVDTADVYARGESEAMLGRFVAERSLRDALVIATKSGFAAGEQPHAGGNGAKHVRAALDASLARLGTDHVDLYWVHVWDQVTPAEELLGTMAALVQAGKVRYWAMSNAPAWYVAQLATLARSHGLPGPIALQCEYSLVSRGIEHEHQPAARALGLGLVPWSPLAGGFLTGKYHRDDPANRSGSRAPGLPDAGGGAGGGADGGGQGRLSGANPFGDAKFSDRNWAILDVLRGVAEEAGGSMAATALAWTLGRPGVTALLIGASRPEQVAGNVAALDVTLTPEQRARLDQASAPEPLYPFSLAMPAARRFALGSDVAAWDEQR